jgi:hypothetical protein
MSRIPRHLAVIFTFATTLTVAACSAPSGETTAQAASSPAASSSAATSPPPAPAAAATSAESSSGYEGFLEKLSCDMLRGWAFDRAQPDRALTVELYDGETLVKTVVADQFRQDLLDARKGNGRHLFIDAPPPELKDGKPHAIRAVVKGAGYALRPLADTPPSMTCTK